MSSGIAQHCYHDKLFGLVWDYEERADYIRTEKPREEKTLRMRLFALIPTERLSPVLAQAVAEGCRLRAEGNRLLAEGYRLFSGSNPLWAEDTRIWDEVNKQRAECNRLRAESNRLWVESLKTHIVELEALHAELCPDCPWDGTTIFTRRNEAGEWY